MGNGVYQSSRGSSLVSGDVITSTWQSNRNYTRGEGQLSGGDVCLVVS